MASAGSVGAHMCGRLPKSLYLLGVSRPAVYTPRGAQFKPRFKLKKPGQVYWFKTTQGLAMAALQWEHFAHGVHNHCPRVITVLGRFFAVALRIRNCYGCYLRVYGHTR